MNKEHKYYCYICGEEITDANKTNEHIILNALGGHLHSNTIICNDCNVRIGEAADCQLAEDLSFYTDMLKVKKSRQNNHNQVMVDEEGHEIIVNNGGETAILRKPYINIENKDGRKRIHLKVRNKKELHDILTGMVKRKELPQKYVEEIMTKAEIEEFHPILQRQICISDEAFPSIIKSATNYYVFMTHDADAVKLLVPYIEGKADTKDVLYLYLSKTLPYIENNEQVTHMIHIEGTSKTRLLYAMMEYYSIYVYFIVFDKNYSGKDINMTYTYDVVTGKEVSRHFSFPLRFDDLEQFRNQLGQYQDYLPFVEKRVANVMNIWKRHVNQLDLGYVT